jgi:hypothetical protein
MKTDYLRGLLEWSLMVALVFGTGAIVQAQQDQSQPEGPIVQIGPADESPASAESDQAMPAPQPEAAPAAGGLQPGAPQYWIGILGGPVTAALRSHLDIPENQGLLVREVVPDSPADKAGLKKYDVLLRANDNDLADMGQLMDLVRTTGKEQGQLSLEVLRRGQRETVWVTPAERPEQVAQPGGFGSGEMPSEGRGFFQGFRNDFPFEFRSFGPGVIVGRGAGFAQLPNGVSVVIQKQGGEPAHITVKRGDETWEIVGDDPKSLDQLPDDLRPVVERMLHGNVVSDFVVPNIPQPVPMPQFDGQRLQEQLEALENHLQKLEERLQALEPQPDQESN